MSRIIEIIETNEYVFAGVVLVATILAAIVINLITRGVLLRMTRKTKTNIDDVLIKAINRPLFVTVVMVGLSFAIERFEIEESVQYIIDASMITLVVILWTGAIKRFGTAILGALAKKIDDYKFVQERTLPLLEIAMKMVVYGGAAYGILLAWHVDVTAWLASAGILGLAIGFAAKDTLANLFSGVFILADAPYKIGDFIVLDSGERGRVSDIGIRSTRLLTRDDIQIIVPNAAIANAKIINETGGPTEKRRVKIDVGVAYGSDIDAVREVLIDVAAKSEYLSQDPAPRVRFRELGDSALKFQLMGWIDEPVFRGRAVDDLLTTIYKRFNDESIEIPFPQQDVHIKQAPSKS
ncbi:MAG: mechanosensitive ion channel [Deltaproteobacteria bacterium]|nr:mechanosensitive ion channel [Deltaproteobacteria bacterium]